ncbi:MAG: AmmeMemoRadiSam system protein A [Candidatus Brocadiaceae bacterium]|mgnify:CR=1 FL=1|nr:AmmeMemoRadiSam system protein A [Candidatus Brocadiaceae bacterium]
MLSAESGETLLQIARRTVEAVVRRERVPEFAVDDPELAGAQGAFVTLKTDGRLRGCIGCFTAEEPLWQVVQQKAIDSATRDPRFLGTPIRPEDLPRLEIEVSVLSPLKPVQDPMNDIVLGTHGIYVTDGRRSGCFLPQVATETGWDKLEFLRHCCAGKAGLPPDAWRDPHVQVSVFTAEVISEQ